MTASLPKEECLLGLSVNRPYEQGVGDLTAAALQVACNCGRDKSASRKNAGGRSGREKDGRTRNGREMNARGNN